MRFNPVMIFILFVAFSCINNLNFLKEDLYKYKERLTHDLLIKVAKTLEKKVRQSMNPQLLGGLHDNFKEDSSDLDILNAIVSYAEDNNFQEKALSIMASYISEKELLSLTKDELLYLSEIFEDEVEDIVRSNQLFFRELSLTPLYDMDNEMIIESILHYANMYSAGELLLEILDRKFI